MAAVHRDPLALCLNVAFSRDASNRNASIDSSRRCMPNRSTDCSRQPSRVAARNLRIALLTIISRAGQFIIQVFGQGLSSVVPACAAFALVGILHDANQSRQHGVFAKPECCLAAIGDGTPGSVDSTASCKPVQNGLGAGRRRREAAFSSRCKRRIICAGQRGCGDRESCPAPSPECNGASAIPTPGPRLAPPPR